MKKYFSLVLLLTFAINFLNTQAENSSNQIDSEQIKEKEFDPKYKNWVDLNSKMMDLEEQIASKKFKKSLKLYKNRYGSLDDFPLWHYSDNAHLVKIALKAGVYPDIHTISNAVEADDGIVISLLLTKAPELVNSKMSTMHRETYYSTNQTLLQEAAEDLKLEAFFTLLQFNPDIYKSAHKDKSDSVENLLKNNIECFCSDRSKNSNESKFKCFKARMMLAELKKYEAEFNLPPKII